MATNPESEPTHYYYDAAGNLTSKFDARSITTTFTLDLFGRVKQKSYMGDAGVTPTVTYCYDNPTCGGAPAAPSVNRLTQVTSSASSMSYTYNTLGQVQASTQTTGTAYPFSYTYNAAGSLLTETYPSNRTVNYDYDYAGRVQMVKGTFDSTTHGIRGQRE